MSGEFEANAKRVKFKESWIENVHVPQPKTSAEDTATVKLDDLLMGDLQAYTPVKHIIEGLARAQRNISSLSIPHQSRVDEVISMMTDIDYSDGFKAIMQKIATGAASRIFEEIGLFSPSADDCDEVADNNKIRIDIAYMNATQEQRLDILEAVSRLYTDEAQSHFDWIKPAPVIVADQIGDHRPVDIDNIAQSIFSPAAISTQTIQSENFYTAVDDLIVGLTHNVTQQIAAGYLAKNSSAAPEFKHDAEIILESAMQRYAPTNSIPDIWKRHPQNILSHTNGKICAINLSLHLDMANRNDLDIFLGDVDRLIVAAESFGELEKTQVKTYENIRAGLSDQFMAMRRDVQDNKALNAPTQSSYIKGVLNFHR